jgi:S1-C subfamily serine protease
MTTEELIDRIARAGQSGDWSAVQRLIGELKRLMTEEGRPLHSAGAYRLVEALSETPMLAASVGPNVYAIADQIKSHAKVRPIDMAALRASWDSFYTLLTNQSIFVETGSIREVLKALKAARAFDLLARTADRGLVREPNDPMMMRDYGQALIDGGQVHAAITMLEHMLTLKDLPREAFVEAHGLLGRAYKQLYVDNVPAGFAPPSVRAKFKTYLQQAITHYAAAYDPSKPGDNYWNGSNLMCMLLLAREDGQDIANPAGVAPEEMAQRMIAALEPEAQSTADPWVLATLGELHLALKEYAAAGQYFGLYARHPAADAFKLAGTARQLEQVWRIKPGCAQAGAILAVLKAAEIGQDEGQFTLPGDGLNALSRFAHSQEANRYAETMVPGGEYVHLAALQVVVRRSAGVAALCDSTGNTMGTGFLLRGGDLCESLGDDLYLLTNGHVMSEPNKEGYEPSAVLDPRTAHAKLEAADGAELKFDPNVEWQSSVAEHDACLVKVTSDPARLRNLALPIAKGRELKAADQDKGTDGTRVSVIGHPLGGPLSLSIVGTLTGSKGVLVDYGSRSANQERPVYLHYRAPTERGNSGSPVFETDKWEVIGLHHMGFDQFEGRPRLKGKPGMHHANEGVCIRCIGNAIAQSKKRKSKLFLRRKAQG